MAALYERGQSGEGQVIDAAMTDGSALLMNSIYGLMGQGVWNHQRGRILLDGGAPFYGTYETKDGKFVSIGSIEPQFYALLLEKTGLADDPGLPRQMSLRLMCCTLYSLSYSEISPLAAPETQAQRESSG